MQKQRISLFFGFAYFYFIGVLLKYNFLIHLSTFLHFQCRNAQKIVDSKKYTIDCLSTYRLIDCKWTKVDKWISLIDFKNTVFDTLKAYKSISRQ